MDGYIVNLDDRTAHIGGSWIPESGDPLQAFGQNILRLFFDALRDMAAPVVLDIGANTGSFCLLSAFIPGMRAYAFEPVWDTYHLLLDNVKANRLDDQIWTYRCALSNGSGIEDMHVPFNDHQRGLAYLDNRESDMPCAFEPVEVMTLDAWSEGYISRIDAIKMDVEGIEARVLRGGEQTIRHDMPLILLEATNTHQTIPLLESWGYTCTDYHTDILAKFQCP